MSDHLEDLDPIYFNQGWSWEERRDEWVKDRLNADPFAPSVVDSINLSLRASESTPAKRSLRMVVNMGAHTLLVFLARGEYLNAYDEFMRRAKERNRPSEMRQKIDAALSKTPESLYFGAVTLSGTGVRFYGEYGVVLRGDEMPPDTRIMDRNSWLIEFPPLKEPGIDPEAEEDSRRSVADRISGTWGSDLLPMVSLKVLPEVNRPVRLPTSGVISEAVLYDENFIEVHKIDGFTPSQVHEVRETPQDAAIEADVAHREERGLPMTPEERRWLRRRRLVADRLFDAGIRRRIVATSGRERG